MRFVDACEVKIEAGKGGNGAVAFRREKYVPFGGPSGGDGGRGGNVIFTVDPGLSTLLDIRYMTHLRAQNGENGGGKDCYGKAGKDLVVRVPPGTQVFDKLTDELLFDLTELDQSEVIAQGGKGGRGNIHFATPYDRAPRRAEPGEPGDELEVRLELKVMADVGLLGFPNAGKSTFVARVSRARPKVADYPFTTLVPQLGVVRIDQGAHFVVADIPGLIPGASDGAGLGIQFLKHVERTRALLHLVTLSEDPERDPVEDYQALRKELEAFDPELAARPELVALSKADLTDHQALFPDVEAAFKEIGVEIMLISSASGVGIDDCLGRLWALVRAEQTKDGTFAPQGIRLKARHAKGDPEQES